MQYDDAASIKSAHVHFGSGVCRSNGLFYSRGQIIPELKPRHLHELLHHPVYPVSVCTTYLWLETKERRLLQFCRSFSIATTTAITTTSTKADATTASLPTIGPPPPMPPAQSDDTEAQNPTQTGTDELQSNICGRSRI